MGTSLTGLTPANTYTGLLKFGDNSAISASLKALSDGDGNDTMISLSTTALQIGGSTGMYWDNTNKRLGIGTNSPNAKLQIAGTASIGNIGNDGVITINRASTGTGVGDLVGYSGGFYIRGGGQFINMPNASQSSIGTSVLSLGATWGIRGSGSTSATTSLLVQNSAGTEALKVRDDLYTKITGSGTSAEFTSYIQLTAGSNIMLIGTSYGYFNGSAFVFGSSAPASSSIVDIQSTTKGFLPPRMTTTQKSAIATPAAGLVVYDTTLAKLCVYTTTWETITSL